MNPKLITWARQRADIPLEVLARSSVFRRLPEWENDKVEPTVNQLRKFARAVRVPEGYLYLPEPPVEKLESFGLNDFRTVGSTKISKLSPDIIDTVAICVSRKKWYHHHARSERYRRVDFINSVKPGARNQRKVAESMAKVLGVGLGEQEQISTIGKAFDQFSAAADRVGVLVMMHRCVGKNYRRKLKTSEFRGLAISDDFAPLVFINGADSISVQMFMLAHELAHLWIGDTGVSSAENNNSDKYSNREKWCIRVADEFLVPKEKLEDIDPSGKNLIQSIINKARRLKVGRHVILRRLLTCGRISSRAHSELVKTLDDCHPKASQGSEGPDEAAKIISRTGERFACSLTSSTLELKTTYKVAFELFGTRNSDTVDEIARRLGVISTPSVHA